MLAVLCGCSTVASFTMEKFGQARRDTLVRRLDKARVTQLQLKEGLQRAMEQFDSLVKFEGGKQQERSDKMSADLARCEARAKEVGARIDEVDRAANNLFRERKAEAKKHPHESDQLNRGTKLRNTHRYYSQMMEVMRNAESKIEPTLAMFRHQVETVRPVLLDPAFYLDDNLNSGAQASLQGESAKLAAQVDFLIQNLSDSIAEADLFIQKISD